MHGNKLVPIRSLRRRSKACRAVRRGLSQIPIKDQDWNIAKLLDNEAVTVVASYASLTDHWYETTIRMADGTPRIPQIVDDRRLSRGRRVTVGR